MRVALVRHLAPDIAPGICYGRTDMPLHPDAPGGDLAALPPGPIWCSPALRCRATAALIARGRDVKLDARLLELNFGAWEGQRWKDVPLAALDRWAADPWHFAPPSGESAAALAARVRSFHAMLRAENRDCVVIAHGGPLKFLASLLTGEALNPLGPVQPIGGMRLFKTGEAHMDDPFDLARFVDAQAPVFEQVLRELQAGRKDTHWMWFVFPQIAGLGQSEMARRYAIGSREEALAYLDHPVLGPRLLKCTGLVMQVENASIRQILGTPDDMKFRSCMTLFGAVAPMAEVFTAALGKFLGGAADPGTLERLEASTAGQLVRPPVSV